jgi:hypothetical protein
LRARTAGELVELTADLPAHAGGEVLELRGVFGSVKQPRRLVSGRFAGA